MQFISTTTIIVHIARGVAGGAAGGAAGGVANYY